KTLLLSCNPAAGRFHVRRASLDDTAPQHFLGRPLFGKTLLLSCNPAARPLPFRSVGRDHNSWGNFLGRSIWVQPDWIAPLGLDPPPLGLEPPSVCLELLSLGLQSRVG